MARSTHHHHYQALLALLRELREREGLTQAELAAYVGNTQTFISKVERGERRIDVIEFLELCEALGQDPVATLRKVLLARTSTRGSGKKLSRRS